MDFYRKMRLVCLAIPHGKVASYGQIALLCGQPNHSRQVGFALKRGLAGNDVPAHRVVNSKGELSGAIHFDMPDEQRFLLMAEGVVAKWNGRFWCVDLKIFGWKNTTAETEEFKRLFNVEKQN